MLGVAGNYPRHRIYEQSNWTCRACSQEVTEDQEHLARCEGYEDLRGDADLENEKELVDFFTRVMAKRKEMKWN